MIDAVDFIVKGILIEPEPVVESVPVPVMLMVAVPVVETFEPSTLVVATMMLLLITPAVPKFNVTNPLMVRLSASVTVLFVPKKLKLFGHVPPFEVIVAVSFELIKPEPEIRLD